MRTPFAQRAFCALLLGASMFGLIPLAAATPSPTATAARIERVPVDSSSLVSIGFAREARILEIQFRSGAIYRYLKVPPMVFEELKKAESKGRYFAQSIRGKYQFYRMEAVSK